MTRRFTALLLSCAMMLSLCQLSLATEKADDNAPVEEKALAEEVIPEEAAAPTDETTTALSETAGLAASQQPTMAGETTDTIYTGTLGDNVTWSLDTASGALTITGSGAMSDYTYSISTGTSPLRNYSNYIKSVTIADDITSVGAFVFCSCVKLTSVNLGIGITSIGNSAFSGCSALTEVVIPGSVASIGDNAFSGCSALAEVVIPDSVTSIGEYAFSSCDSLSAVTFGSGVASVGWSAFASCYKLQKVAISDAGTWMKITFGDRYANPLYYAHTLYVGDALLTDLVIPSTVTSINSHALDSCTSITSVFIPQSIKSVGWAAFSGMTNLKTVNYAGSQDEWMQITIDSYNEPLTNLTPAYDQSMEWYCCITAAAAEHGTVTVDNTLVQTGDTVTIIALPTPGYAVETYLLDGVEIPNGDSTFTATKNHVISATFIEAYVVADDGKACGTLGASITWALDTEGILHIDGAGLMNDYDYNESPLVPYRGSIQSVDFPGSITNIGSNVFYGCRKLTKIEIPDSVTSIGESSFDCCYTLADVVIPDSVTSIGKGAFSCCNALTKVVIPGSVNSIGDGAYYSCVNLAKAVISDGTTSIGNNAFKCCSALMEVVIPDSVNSIGYCAFYDCGSLTEVAIPYGVASIEEGTFYGCSALAEAVIPNSVTSIGYRAFYGCGSLSEVVIPNSVTSIDGDTFRECTNLTAVTIGSGVKTIKDYAFDSCGKLASAEFLGNTPYLGRGVFMNSSSFRILYHINTSGWTSPKWNGYAAACVDPRIADFHKLDDNNRNVQNILFLLNDTAMTATVGASTSANNNAGYDGGNRDQIVIPDIVTKGEGERKKEYKVIGINRYAFANHPWVKTVSVGKNVSAIEPSAFRGCENLTAINVDKSNLQFADQDGVLFDKEGLYLYAYPAGRDAATYAIPDTCTTVGVQAFNGAANLIDLIVPTSVNDIGKAAFENCNALQSIELPFFGGNAQSNSTLGYIFSEKSWSDNVCPASLKRITVHGTNLSGSAFRNCSSLKEIYLPDCDALTEIPYQCFSNCRSLQTLTFGTASSEDGMVMIPNTVTTINSSAFAGCSSLRGVTLGRGVTTLGQAAFNNCSSIEKFAVASGNTSYMADQWGVLYSANQTTLHYYPSARAWPYYNASDKTTTICSYAFSSCKDLVNLFIPKTATSFGSYCISGCPSMTICCYKDSAVARYAISEGLTAWYMDNYTLQGLSIRSLPEQLVFDTHNALVSTPYLTATYGDKQLQVDDYQVQLSKPYGAQTVTFTAGACSASAQATVIRQGDINGDSTTTASVVDVQDMQCLYEYLSTDEITGNLKDDAEYFSVVADVNGDSSIDILDYQALYDATRS